MRGLLGKISSGRAVVGVIGLGNVGLSVPILNARRFEIFGYDIDSQTIHNLVRGLPTTYGVSPAGLPSCLANTFFPASRESELEECDTFVICVPTPLLARNEPDLIALTAASKLVDRHLRKGTMVVLESTTYRGETDCILVPILEEREMRAGTDIYVAYLPERIDPGRRDAELECMPKVFSGHDGESTLVASKFSETCFERVAVVSDRRKTEATKMHENIFRAVNIPIANELTPALGKMDINAWHLIEAASTKAFGFMAFHPGPGIGGHRIPLDAYYFVCAARRVGVLTRFIELSGDVSSFMPRHVVDLLRRALRAAGKNLKGLRMAVLSLSYKRNVSDTRESPWAEVLEEAVWQGGTVDIHDPHAKGVQTGSGFLQSASSTESALKYTDGALFLGNHSGFQRFPTTLFRSHMKPNPELPNCRNVFATPPPGTTYVGLGKTRGLPAVPATTAVR